MTSDKISQLTLEEKAALCVGMNAWETVPVERLGIPSITMSDGPHGLRRTPGIASKSLPATCFPTASALASSWDIELVHELGQALADECIALGVDILLGPGNNMKRTPLCGRNFEYFSEDPYLGGEMAASFINGVQSKGVGTSLKHYAANNQETARMTVSADIDERTLREIYLAGFERAVKKAQPWTVMCCYNRVNGTYGSEHKWLLTDILKDEWGLEGFVVSDWGAVHNRVTALAAGLDLEMPGPQIQRVQRVVEAVQSGQLPESALDAAVERVLDVIFKAVQTKKGHTTIDIDAHHALARRIAAETMVLLKNDHDLLPLRQVKKLAVIGKTAKEAHFQGGGSSHINPTKVDSPLDELRKLAGDAELLYAEGYTMDESFDQAMIDEAVKVATQAEIALLYIGLPPFKESEGYDRPDIDLSDQQVALIKAVAAAQPRCVVILNSGSAVAMSEWIDAVPAVLEAWLMGQAGGGAIADVLFGKVNPSGRLAETFPIKLSHTPAFINFPGQNDTVRYGEGLFIGYRYYEAREMDVLFPFGYGLSYTTFEYHNLRLSSQSITDTDSLTVSVDVTNTGKVAGKTVVQVYVHDQASDLVRPYKELKGFAKVAVLPGETRTATIQLDARAFAYYHPRFGRWVTESGAFDILVGQSAADNGLRATVTVESAQVLSHRLHHFSTLREWFDDPRGAAVVEPVMQEMIMTISSGSATALAIDAIEWAKDLPLDVVFAFWGRSQQLPAPPEEIVDDLLSKLEGPSENPAAGR
jgi:beta-glucosidase